MATPQIAGSPPIAGTYVRLALRAFLYWIPLGLVVTVLAGLVYVAVQQNFRMGANDPQIQMAEDAAARLEAGDQPQAIVGSGKIDMARSLAPYLIVYDDAGKVLAASVQLNGQTPPLPDGVLSATRQSGEDRISWQPQEGVRSAAIVVRAGGTHPGFVLAGRSLREVEDRESQLTLLVGLAWLAAMAGSLVLLILAFIADNRFLQSRGE